MQGIRQDKPPGAAEYLGQEIEHKGNAPYPGVDEPEGMEMTVALAFLYFAEEEVDVAIIETGLGGSLDSTNIIFPELSLITNIGKDHMQFLGDSLPEIAQEKAGIIKENTPVIIGKLQKETTDVFAKKAQKESAPLQYASLLYNYSRKEGMGRIDKGSECFLKDLRIPLQGDYQKENIQLAVAAADLIGINKISIRKGLEKVVENTSFMGRWQILNKLPLCIADTAHNEDGLTQVMKQIQAVPYEKLHMVIGLVDDKLLDHILPLFPQEATYYFCKANIPRGLAAHDLAAQAAKYQLFGRVFDSVEAAWQHAKAQATNQDLVFVGGSTFTVAEVV